MTDKNSSRTQKFAVTAYITVCILWGSTYLAIRIAVLDLPPLFSAGIRFACAGAVMLCLARLKHRPSPGRTQVRNQSIIGLALLLGGNGMIVLGSQWISSGIVALLFATAPLFIAIGETFLPRGEKLTLLGWVGLFVGFSGVAYLVLGGGEVLNIPFKGALILLLGSAFWALGSILSKRLKSQGAIEFDLGIQMLVGGLGLMAAGLLTGEGGRMTITQNGVFAILYLIVFGSLLGYNAYIYLLRVWPATRASTYTYVNPFVAIFLGFLLLREPLSIHVFVGTGIILSGVFMVQFSCLKPPALAPAGQKADQSISEDE